MFKYVTNLESPTQLDVLISLYNDIRDTIGEGGIPHTVYLEYVKRFPQHEQAITRQYNMDKSQGFPSEDMTEEIGEENEHLVEEAVLELEMMQSNPGEFKEYLEYLRETAQLLSDPKGQLVYEIEQRFIYLDKYYINKRMGFNAPLKEW
jgi:hypothetical protein